MAAGMNAGSSKIETSHTTLPIYCQICLERVRKPVMCSNNHVFCHACMDVWLQRNKYCPACRTVISPNHPLKQIKGGMEEVLDDNGSNPELRKTRFQRLYKEYEDEFEKLQSESLMLRAENDILKARLRTGSAKSSDSISSDISNSTSVQYLNKKVLEAQTLNKKIKEELDRVKKENDRLKDQNVYLSRENEKLRLVMSTRSPQKFGRTTVATLENQVDGYENQIRQLNKALDRSDHYIDSLEQEVQKTKQTPQIPRVSSANSQSSTNVKNSDNDSEYTKRFNPSSNMGSSSSIIRPSSVTFNIVPADSLTRYHMDKDKKSGYWEARSASMTKGDPVESPSTSSKGSKKVSFFLPRKERDFYDSDLSRSFHEKQSSLLPPTTATVPPNGHYDLPKINRDGSHSSATDMRKNKPILKSKYINYSSNNNNSVLSDPDFDSAVGSNDPYLSDFGLDDTQTIQSELDDLNISLTPELSDCMKLLNRAEKKVHCHENTNVTSRREDDAFTSRHEDDAFTSRHEDDAFTSRHEGASVTSRHETAAVTSRHEGVAGTSTLGNAAVTSRYDGSVVTSRQQSADVASRYESAASVDTGSYLKNSHTLSSRDVPRSFSIDYLSSTSYKPESSSEDYSSGDSGVQNKIKIDPIFSSSTTPDYTVSSSKSHSYNSYSSDAWQPEYYKKLDSRPFGNPSHTLYASAEKSETNFDAASSIHSHDITSKTYLKKPTQNECRSDTSRYGENPDQLDTAVSRSKNSSGSLLEYVNQALGLPKPSFESSSSSQSYLNEYPLKSSYLYSSGVKDAYSSTKIGKRYSSLTDIPAAVYSVHSDPVKKTFQESSYHTELPSDSRIRKYSSLTDLPVASTAAPSFLARSASPILSGRYLPTDHVPTLHHQPNSVHSSQSKALPLSNKSNGLSFLSSHMRPSSSVLSNHDFPQFSTSTSVSTLLPSTFAAASSLRSKQSSRSDLDQNIYSAPLSSSTGALSSRFSSSLNPGNPSSSDYMSYTSSSNYPSNRNEFQVDHVPSDTGKMHAYDRVVNDSYLSTADLSSTNSDSFLTEPKKRLFDTSDDFDLSMSPIKATRML